VILCAASVLGLVGPPARADWSKALADPDVLAELPEPDSAYYAYLKARRTSCVGDGVLVEPAVELAFGDQRFSFSGPRLARVGADPDGVVTLGVLGAIKDFSPESRHAMDRFFERFEKAAVDAVVLLGDLAATETEITQILLYTARRGWPVMALIGNTEGRSAFNNAFLAALKLSPNLVNLDLIRRVDLGAVALVSVPGYIDRRFVHQTSGCTYKPEDLDRVKPFLAGDVPVVLLSHGPPAGKDAAGLDHAVEAGNVGDPHLAGLMREARIPFGLFSHILEAGGRAVDAQGKPLTGGVFRKEFQVNIGSANPLAWQLNSGKVSCGMGLLARFRDGQGAFEFVHLPCK
jgi:Icc-related predicted phosphoesterase